MDRISAYVYDESNVYNEAWARRLDIELNIRDNQATALEVAMYVRGEFAEDKQPLTDAQVTAAGIAREGKIGSIGYRIGRHACDSVMDALRDKAIEDSDALAIADFCPGNESVQGKGLKVILDGGSKTEARARMEAELAKQKMAREVGVEGGTDLFGNTLEDEAFWDFVAKYVVGRRNELAKDALFLRTNVGKRNSSAMTKKYGVDLKDPESLKKALKEIDMLRERWKNPYGEADLMEEIKQAWQERQEGEGKPVAQVFERYAQRLREGERGVTDYSVSPTLKEDLHEAFENRYGEDKDLPLCDSPRLFRVLGIVPAPIVTRQRIVRKLRLTHKLSETQIAEAVLRFDDPLGVIVENRNAVIVLPGMLARNKAGKDSDMMSAIRLQRAKNGEHFMASLYPLDNLQKIEDQLRQGNLRYCKYNAKALANVSSNASGGTMTPALVRLLIHQGFNENTIIGSENVKGENSISVSQAQERGMFKDGVMEVSNGVILAPDTDYSVDFSHASYELFRKPDKKHVGKGEGVQVFGWACIYGAESWETNKFYHGNFTQKVIGGFSLNGKVVSERAVLKQLNKETGKEYLLKFLNGAFRSNADEYRQLIEENRGWIKEDKKRLAEAERGYIDGKKRSEAEIKEEKAHLENAIKNRTSKLEAYEWLAKNEVHKVEDSVRYPVNYLMRADVDDSNLLHWDVPEFVGRDLSSPDIGGAYYGREMVEKILGLDMKEPTEDLVRALWDMMQKPDVPEEGYVAFKDSVNIDPIEYEFSSKEFDAADYDMETLLYWGEYIANVCMTGKEVYNALVRSLGSPRAASEWLDEHGVRGVKYYDGTTRHKEGEKVYNYAIFNPDYIEVVAINNRHAWSEYSEDNPDWQRPEEIFGEGDGVTDYSVRRAEEDARRGRGEVNEDEARSVRNLAAVHTLSVENFLKQAKEWGGMPLPSVAITRLDKPYDWEVDHEPMVMLVGRPGMVDPERGAEVYARDAWMGRMPEVEEERGEDGKVRRFFYDENDEKVDATLENMTEHLMRWKQKGNSAQETPDAARSLMARRLRSMEEVKGRRRMLQAEPENRVTDGEIYEWMDMATEYDWGWNAKKARTLFRVLAEVDEVTKEGVLAAIMRSEEADLMELQNGLEEDSGFIRETVRVLKEMRKERRNYVEATPRRVVGMDEWVYAVYSENLEGKDEVRRVCLENGIVPVEYKEGARDEALWGLAYDTVVSFSVAGMRARTAGANMDRVYRDPADGKEKFVIPTANARLSTGFTLGQLKAPVGGHKDVTLGAVLEYPELYEAYPELKGMRVRLYNPRLQEGVGGFFARPRGEKAGYLALNTGVEVTPERVLETLLHESQHAIQAIEGHAMGAGSMNAEEALEYLDRAIAARKGIMKAAGDDAWSRENLAYLEAMRGMVQGKEGRKMQEMAISQVYWYSHGEQEARFTGAGKDGDPMAEGSGLTENSPTTYTIAAPGEATELGGVTFGGMGRFSYLLESRLGTAGEFNYDRAVYQMKEAVVRRMKELRMLGDSKDERARGVQLAAEALATMESLESLLPATYRFGLEAYKVYFSSYAKLAGSGSAAAAGRMVPMAGWGERMKGAYEKIARMAVEGYFYKGDMEFWGEHWKKVERILPPLQEKWEELQKMYVGGLLRGKARQDAINAAWRELRHELPEEMRTLMQAVGEVRADKLMAKFMERVALQLDAFRKDKTLGRIRRVVGALKPGAKENGKPVKGRMDAERYRKVVDMVRLMELTRGEKELFERERYTGEGTEKAWADLEPNDTVTVRTYDGEGKEVEIACSKEEFETYACFETMTASQAEAASRALGEYISTGRQAWDNAQEAARKRIEALCAPALEKYGETENELKARRERQQRKAMPLVNKTLNFLGFGLNDAQFFDVCSKVPEIEKWTKDAVYRIASAHTYIEAKERDRQEFMTRAAREASGEKDDKKVREWLDDTRRNRDTGIKLAPQEPDFDAQETETVRRQFMGLLRRKTHKKNFNPNTFAEALRYLTEEDGLMPEAVAREALDKYGTLGDAKASRLHGKEALMVLLTDNEYARFSDLTMTAKKRAEAAREKWQKEREEEETKRKEEGKPKEKENGTLVLSPAQAAYRVLLWEQADYTDNLIMQGYTPEVVQRLREFAGEKVMRMAYALREKMGERTEEIRDMYERVYGMPFPEVENYFRAFFDVAYETRQEGIMSGEGAGYAAGAGTMKILYHRNHRNARIDPTMTMYEAFNAGMKEQDLLLGYGELPSELLRILNYKEGHQTMSDALEKCLGSGALSEMRQHVENMSRLVPEVERYARAATRVISEWSSAGAQMILSWRQGSLVKQLTAFFNGVAGSEYVGVLDYFTSLGKVLMGLGRIKLKDLAERPELKGRFKGWENAENMKAMLRPADVRTAMPKAAVFAGKGMAAMEWLDVWANVRQAAAIYDAAYRKLRLKVPNATPEELDGLAMQEVQHALALKSQPLDWRQRSLGSLKKSPFTIGSFFLGGESVNTFANFARLLAKHEYMDAAAVWLSHGFGLQALTALYNFITDDKEQWEKRSLGGYFLNALLGPLGGVPLLSSAYNEWVWKPFHRKAKWLPYVQTTDLIPAADIERLYREWSKANKSGEWEAYTLACDDTLRVVATITLLAARNSTSKAGFWAKAGAVIAGGVGNIVDFFVRVERAAKERWRLWD